MLRKKGFRPGFFAFGFHKSAVVVGGGLNVVKEKARVDTLSQTDTGVANTYLPTILVGLTVNTKDMSAADSNQVVALGQVCVATGNAFEGEIADTASATNFRITAVVNRSGGTLLVSVADESNMKINGQGKRMSIEPNGYAVLMEIANDNQSLVAASGVTLVAYAT